MDGHKTETQVTESKGKVGSPQCARKESGRRVGRTQCPSVCHQFTLSLGHMWNDPLHSLVVYKTCVNSSRKMSTLSGCEPVSPSRIRLPVKAIPARHCQKSPISPRHLGRRNTQVNIRLVAHVPLTLHTDAQLVREFPPDGSTCVSLSPGLSTRLSWRSRTRIS